MSKLGSFSGALMLATALAPVAALVNDAQAQTSLTQQAQADRSHRFNIPSQPLASAVNQFSSVTGLQVGYPAELARGLSSQGVSGEMTADAALAQLLAGSGLTYRFTGTTTVALERATTGTLNVAPATVLGTRAPGESMSNVPSSLTRVSRAELEKQKATSDRIEDILSHTVPGFNPSNNGVRQIRGRNAQVFMNGVPLNEQLRASSGSDLNLLPPEHLDGIEVSRGANSAYGFGSPGGIIALTTPRAESETLALTTKLSESFNPHQVGGSSRTTLYQSASQIVGKFDYHFGVSGSYDGLAFDPDGERAGTFNGPNGLTNQNEGILAVDGSFGLDMGDAGTLRLTSTYSHTDVLESFQSNATGGSYRRTQNTIDRFQQGDDGYRDGQSYNLTYENPDVLGSALRLELLASEVYTEAYALDGARTYRDEQTNQYFGVRSAVTTKFDELYEGLSATYGVDLLRNRYFRPTYFEDTGAFRRNFSPDVTLDSAAPYIQLGAPIGDFQLSGGVRYERYRGSAETSTGTGGIRGGVIEPFGLTLFNAGVVYNLPSQHEVFASFSQGAEITQLGRAAASAGTVDNVNPQPATSDQYEVGLRMSKGPLQYGLSTFYTESDLMSSVTCDGINPCVPLREPRKIWGIEANTDWQIDEQWKVGGILTWQEGTRKISGGDIRRITANDVTPLLVSGYLDYAPYSWWRNTLQIDFRNSKDSFGASTTFGEGRIDSVTLVHLAAAFDVGPGELHFGIRNLFNEKYFSIKSEAGNTASLWVPEEGTRILTSYVVKW